MTTYADTSFMVSRYLADVHSAECDRRMNSHPAIWNSPLNRSELAHALHQNVFWRNMSLSEVKSAWIDFEDDCRIGIWTTIGFPDSAWTTSIALARQHGPTLGVRALDSLHVACAFELKAERFWTFDQRQARLAEAVGLNTSA